MFPLLNIDPRARGWTIIQHDMHAFFSVFEYIDIGNLD